MTFTNPKQKSNPPKTFLQNAMCILGGAGIITGSLFIAGGIIETLIEQFNDSVPTVVSRMSIDHDHIPLALKFIFGAGGISGGCILISAAKKSKP